MKKILTLFLFFSFYYVNSQSTIILDINTMESKGQVTITPNTGYNLGNKNDIFDGDESTLARTNGVNPSFVTLVFDSSFTFVRSDMLQTWGSGHWSFEAANSLNDLTNQSGSYDSVIMQQTSTQWVWSKKTFTPRTKSVLRGTVTKTSGDNNVHISEWIIYASKVINPDSVRLRGERTTVYLNDTLLYQFRGWEAGFPFYFYDNVTWTSLNPVVATVSQTGWIKGKTKGTTYIVASWGSFSDTLKIIVTNNPSGDDLNVLYIKRIPELNYVANSANPSVDGWPQTGQPVIWRAYVKNWVGDSVKDIEYLWKLNGVAVDSGIIHFAPNQTKTLNFTQNWSFTRDEIELTIDNDKWHSEEQESNNSQKIYTDALSVHFYVEQSVYNYFRTNQKKLNKGRNCWEDWAQANLTRFNNALKNAYYPAAPNGVIDHLRIDSIIVVPDNILPYSGGNSASYQPKIADSTCDLQYGFPATLLSTSLYTDVDHANTYNPFYFQDSLLYELGKARYLIDLFAFNVIDTGNGGTVDIMENGQYISGTPVLPYLSQNMVYYCLIDGLMNNDWVFVDEFSTYALNRIAGHRPVAKNYYPADNYGVYINDFPKNNRFTFRDQNGFPIPNAIVKVFQSVPGMAGGYSHYFDSLADIVKMTDQNGQVIFDSCPFSNNHIISQINQGVMLIKLEANGLKRYSFFESPFFNIEYWKGNTDTADYSMIFYMIPYSIEELKTENKMLVYPNPASEMVNLEFWSDNNEEILLSVNSLDGKTVNNQLFTVKSGVNQLKADVANLPKGFYVIKLSGKSIQLNSTFIKK